MQLSEYKVKDFVEELSSNSPAPGGGSASALLGAIGTALVSMVANLTSGKEKFKEKEPILREILEEAEKIKNTLISLIDEDTNAYNEVSKVFKMPKNTEEEKRIRAEALEEALKKATLVPFSIMEQALKGIKLHYKALGNTTKSAISDLGVGVLSLETALYGGWLNVKINLNSIKDKDFTTSIEEKAKKILDEGSKIADEVYKEVEKELA
ncbi:cyclodeaminase/cyclohydrolase family protein [Caldanaerobacter subterraneus]|uniref:Cyclodeaminase/cyclohydrolase family protein n=1 Tax=Caldanaerobacter subterraneus TaxID=911092 RepID=A0A7Y2L4Z8_9THEO|nr:cyclodeaminase/cyclohydrolase family protein [Caldanaerobacter subterraneus]